MCLSDGPSLRGPVYGRTPEGTSGAKEKSAWPYISKDSLLENIKVLASD